MTATIVPEGSLTPPAVSVVVPCYNAEAWIGETLSSVVGQVGISMEIVLVDDGSDDRSLAEAQAVCPSGLRIIRRQRGGASAARNTGTEAARGTFVQYLDADDVLTAETLAVRVEALNDGGGDVAYCDWLRWQPGLQGALIDGPVTRRVLGDRADVEILTGAWWPPGALLYRRSFLGRVGLWRDDLPVIQDARFLLDAALAGGVFVHVPHVGLKYREHNQSLSRRDRPAFLRDCLRSADDLHEEWRRAGTLDEPRRCALIEVYGGLARAYFDLDRVRFAWIIDRLSTLDPKYTPAGPPALRVLSRTIGYAHAEQVASWWRSTKHVVERLTHPDMPRS